nr:MAG TPA: KilA-N domain [Caudoviricetes sp.]
MATNNRSLTVQGVEIHLAVKGEEDYISLTDMTQRFEGGSTLIEAWLRNKDTVEFLGVWERLHNPAFNSPEFEGIRNRAGLNRFTLSVRQWMQVAGGIGLVARAGRYGGTFAHKDIAFEFGSWLSPEFKLYLIQEFQRLKQEEAARDVEWDVRRTLAKVQYRVHTDAIKENLIPPQLPVQEAGLIYASEADVINLAVFGMTAGQWRHANPDAKGNIRDAATLEQLVVLSSLESQNALLIQQGVPQPQRTLLLNKQARQQLASLLSNPSMPSLKGGRSTR